MDYYNMQNLLESVIHSVQAESSILSLLQHKIFIELVGLTEKANEKL